MESREFISEMTRGKGIKGYIKKKLYSHINACFHIILDNMKQQENKINKQENKINKQENKINEQENKINEQENKINEQENKINKQENKINEQENKINKQENKINEQENKINEQENTIIELNDKIKHLSFGNNYLKKQLKELKLINTDKIVEVTDNVKVKDDASYVDIDYFDFENHFRGSFESVKKRQEIYLKYFLNRKNVLDIGCGRGEFLSLMKENNIPAMGVDIYDEYVEYCNTNDLEAVTGDGIAYLHNSTDKYGGIFVGQVIEHISLNQIVSICNDAYSKLEPGASIIFETPNPRCLSTYVNAFYIDPTHVKPVHPLTMKYFLEKAGFKCIKIINTSCSKEMKEIPVLDIDVSENNKKSLENFNAVMHDISEMIYGSQDYAIVATKITKDVDWNHINFIPLMCNNKQVSFIDEEAYMTPNGIIFGPYINLLAGTYDVHFEILGNVNTASLRVTSNNGKCCHVERKALNGDNCIRLVIDNIVSNVEFVVYSNDDSINVHSIWYEKIG